MLDVIKAISQEAGRLALSHFGQLAEDTVDAKGPLDLVTVADRAVEAYLLQELNRAFPQDGVFGEEGSDQTGTSGRVWVIDPIDGTFNFVRGGDEWGVSIGLYQDGKPVFGILNLPVRQEIYIGGRLGDQVIAPEVNGKALPQAKPLDLRRASTSMGFHPIVPVAERVETISFVVTDAGLVMRTCGSCIASLMELARGETDGYLGNGESSWDVMAAFAILGPLGFTSTIDWSQHDLHSKFKFAVGNKAFLKLVSPLVDENTRFLS